MSKLLKRIQQLETQFKDTHGLIPHTEEWFEYWCDRLYRAVWKKEGDLSGMTLEFIRELIARGAKQSQCERNGDRETNSHFLPESEPVEGKSF